MKLQIEIKDDTFKYSWEFKEGGREQGTMHVQPAHFILFSEFLKELIRHRGCDEDSKFQVLMRQVTSSEYIANNLEEVKATIKKLEKL